VEAEPAKADSEGYGMLKPVLASGDRQWIGKPAWLGVENRMTLVYRSNGPFGRDKAVGFTHMKHVGTKSSIANPGISACRKGASSRLVFP
jgi:hypothetical protein